MKYTTIPITKVEELQVGDIWEGIELTPTLFKGSVGVAARMMCVHGGITVQRPVQEVSEPIEPLSIYVGAFFLDEKQSSVYPSVNPSGDAIGKLFDPRYSGKTFREVTQDSVSRVLTPEQIRGDFFRWHTEEDGKRPTLDRLEDAHLRGVKFATGCSLLESSEQISSSAEDVSRLRGLCRDVLGDPLFSKHLSELPKVLARECLRVLDSAKPTGEGEDRGEREVLLLLASRWKEAERIQESNYKAGYNDGIAWCGNTLYRELIASSSPVSPSPRQDSADTETQKEKCELNEDATNQVTHWSCKCNAIHSLHDEACPLCGDRRTDVFRREVDKAIESASPTPLGLIEELEKWADECDVWARLSNTPCGPEMHRATASRLRHLAERFESTLTTPSSDSGSAGTGYKAIGRGVLEDLLIAGRNEAARRLGSGDPQDEAFRKGLGFMTGRLHDILFAPYYGDDAETNSEHPDTLRLRVPLKACQDALSHYSMILGRVENEQPGGLPYDLKQSKIKGDLAMLEAAKALKSIQTPQDLLDSDSSPESSSKETGKGESPKDSNAKEDL